MHLITGRGNLHQWGDQRLIETYRRLSHDLRQRSFDEQLAHQMGRVEEELRARSIDPDTVIRTDEELLH